jgi:hypothetical protein
MLLVGQVPLATMLSLDLVPVLPPVCYFEQGLALRHAREFTCTARALPPLPSLPQL